ncbi:MAG TPA: trigger factor [Xanthomonadales bacterium]|nr:trigger factor [Xanthomonadales bacterium]
MQVSVENAGGLERRVTVQIPEAEIQQKVDSRLQELSKQVKIKGFRPGRVPMSVIRQRYGKQVRLEVANEAMQASLQQAIRDEKLRPASTPQIPTRPEGISKGDLQFTAVVEVFPEFGHLDVSALSIQKPSAEVTINDVDAMLNTLREQRRAWNQVDRAAQGGDQVQFEYAAETAEGRVPQQGHQRLAILMGASGFAGLEAALTGLKAGEEISVELEFPEQFREPALAGKTAQTGLKVSTVSASALPEIDEEFVRSFGVANGSVDSLRSEVKANLERELRQAIGSLMKVSIIEALLQASPDLAVPDSIVRQEAASLAARGAAQAGREAAPEEATAFMAKATERVRGGLLMGEIARQNQIRIDRARVRQAIETIAQTYEEPAEVVQLYYGNQQLLGQVENSVLEEQVVDWVLENAKVSSKEMKFQDVISDATGKNR